MNKFWRRALNCLMLYLQRCANEEAFMWQMIITTALLLPALTFAADVPAFELVKTINLPKVEGRIDHLAFDAKGKRLLVAALGNNTVEVVDVEKGERVHTIAQLDEPQG